MLNENDKARIKVTLGLLGLTGVLVLVGIVSDLFNQISARF